MDFYPTPAVATHALLDVENFNGFTMEPACGDGSMVQVLNQRNVRVDYALDINDHGWGDRGDFLDWSTPVENIITNPPYSRGLLMPFVEHCLEVATSKVALLMRLVFLETAHRYEFFQRTPPSRVWVFPYRIPFKYKGNPKPVTGVSYAWYVWDIADMFWLKTPELNWIPLESQHAER